jgi:ribosomal protein S8
MNTLNNTLNRLQQAYSRFLLSVFLPYNKEILLFLNLLRKEGFIYGYTFKTNYIVCVFLKYYFNKPLIKRIKVFNKKTQNLSFSFLEVVTKVPALYPGFLIFMTNKGLLTYKQMLFYKTGGRLLCQLF